MHLVLRRPVAWLVAIAIAAGLMLMAPVNTPPAEAGTGCIVDHYWWSTGSKSSPLTCQARSYTDCRHNSYSYVTHRAYGPWVSSAQWSWAWCPSGFYRYGSGYQVRIP